MTKLRDADDVRQAVADAAAAGTPLEVVGRGTKRGLGRPMQTGASLDLDSPTWLLEATCHWLGRRLPKTDWVDIFKQIRFVRRSRQLEEEFQIDGPRLLISLGMISQTGGHGDFRMPFEVPRAPAAPLAQSELGGISALADGPDQVRLRAREQGQGRQSRRQLPPHTHHFSAARVGI